MSISWDLSCKDWEERIRAGQSLIPDLPIDRNLSRRAIEVFNKLRLPDVPGKPPLGLACGEWFREFVGVLFGSIIKRERMIREGFLLVAKKNSKTSYSAGLMLTALLLNQRPRAEFLFIGPTKAVADIAFSQASGMIQDDTYLSNRFHRQENLKKITDEKTGAILQIKAFDTSVLTGTKPSGVLIDELHEISANRYAARIIGQIRGGLLPNPEAFLVFITTQSDIIPSGAFKAELTRARNIRDGLVQGKMLPILYEFPEDIAQPGEGGFDPPWYNTDYWPMVNPNLNRSVTLSRLSEDFETAKQSGESEIRRWASQHLNIEIGLALRSDCWAGALWWEQQKNEELNLDEIIIRSEVLAIGIDGGGLDDLLSLCVLGRESDTKNWLCWTKSWVNKKVLSRHRSEVGRFEDFEKVGDLGIVEDPGQDIEELADLCLKISRTGKLSKIGLDPMGVGAIIDALAEREIDNYTIGISQGWKLTGAIKTTERKLSDQGFWHCNQAINAWAVGNAKVELKGNATVITKQMSGTGKIDPVMAVFDAVAIMSTNPAAKGSIYDDEGEYKRIFKRDQNVSSPEVWSPEILQDINHPQFEKHKKLFELWQIKQPDEDPFENWLGR